MAITRLHRLLAVWSLCYSSLVFGFAPKTIPHYRSCPSTTTALGMGKQIRSKQAELAKKLALAKKENYYQPEDVQESETTKRLTDKEVKAQNDRKRFAELLQKQSSSLSDLSSDGYLNKQQEEAEIDAYRTYNVLARFACLSFQ
jgi:hypothetical protein